MNIDTDTDTDIAEGLLLDGIDALLALDLGLAGALPL